MRRPQAAGSRDLHESTTQTPRAMPSTTLTTPEHPTTADGWRPNSAISAMSGKSSKPLFGRWARNNRVASSSLEMPRGAKDGETASDGFATTRRASLTAMNPTAPASTLTREEFEALPIAIQRKYFSTLERLRFAQDSGTIYHHYDDISAHKIRRRKSRQDRGATDRFATRLRRQSQLPQSDSLILENLPDKIKRREFSREDQLVLARRLRASVILDAADEAIYKIGRRASKTRNLSSETTPTLSHEPSMESVQSDRLPAAPAATKETGVPDSFYDSFRWLDDEEDLDLRLFLDDYHTNLREALPVPAKEHRPSFRRHLSITKSPFGRSSLSSSRPATKDATTPQPYSPLFSPPGTATGAPQHMARRKSRALSLITPRHAPSASLASIDAAAAHYQDPEARLKLRVYLASPQKFDEAIEFGFPSADALADSPVIAKGSADPWKGSSRQKGGDEFDHMKTFLDDDEDEDELDSDHGSSPESESPKTPHLDQRPTTMRVSTEPPYSHRLSENYAQLPASSREMTLRMTLTRPDLRAHEEQIYGWQGGRRLQSTSMRDDAPVAPTYIGEGRPKESIENMFAGIDHWGPDPADGGVMKRFWNKVRRS